MILTQIAPCVNAINLDSTQVQTTFRMIMDCDSDLNPDVNLGLTLINGALVYTW